MTRKTLFYLFVFGAFTLTTTNSFGQNKKDILEKTTVASNSIPADFDFNETLVVALRGFNFYDKSIKKITEKNFGGKVVYAAPAELKKLTDEHRYVLSFEIKRYTKDYVGPDANGKQYDLDYYIYSITDTKTGKIYTQGMTHFNWDRLYEGYMVNLEAERLKK
ncbi:MAG: hypothetical protein KDC84_14645 [Crocinitomicaceae bacterium]|nr:hypothetical protein [Crocinitomicaceae bacterium]